MANPRWAPEGGRDTGWMATVVNWGVCEKEIERERKTNVADENKETEFKVIDRRPFTADGELRKEVVAEQEREDAREAKVQAAKEVRQAANNAAAGGSAGGEA